MRHGMEFATCSHKELLIFILTFGSLTLTICFILSLWNGVHNLWLHCDAECMAWLKVKPNEQSFFDKLF